MSFRRRSSSEGVSPVSMPSGSNSLTLDGGGRLSRRAWGGLLVLCGALFLDALDVSMIGVALPSIRTDLHLSTSSLQWVVSAYVLGYGGFLLLGGRAADLLGRRRVFLISLGVFVVASTLGGLAHDGSLLIATRFIKGMSAAFTAPAGLSIITTTFAEGPARNKALSVYTATGATGFSLGLVFSGLMTEIGWRWVFFLPVPVALATLLAATRLVPRDVRPVLSSRSFDVTGAFSLTAGMLLLVFTVVEAPDAGWGSVRTLASFAGAAAILAGFVAIERRTASPLVRLGILRSGSPGRVPRRAARAADRAARDAVRRHAADHRGARIDGDRLRALPAHRAPFRLCGGDAADVHLRRARLRPRLRAAQHRRDERHRVSRAGTGRGPRQHLVPVRRRARDRHRQRGELPNRRGRLVAGDAA